MDRLDIKKKLLPLIKKYRYGLLILALGLILMMIPERQEKPQAPEIPETQPQTADMQADLEQILSQIEGAGRVEVLLTQAAGPETVYQSDREGAGDLRQETVILSGADKGQYGLIQRIDPPVYLGAVVVCQGADRAAVRLAIVEAVANATGLSADKISVLKMK